MLGARDFRRMALAMRDAVEGAHMGHPDFRVNGRVFATIQPGEKSGMVKLTPEQQQELVRDHPGTFAPESGAWGRGGCTRVTLNAVDEDTLGQAMTLAWQNLSVKAPARKARAKSKPASRSTAKRKRR